ncbi:MAG TPA: S24 family peptidase, partial [Pseudobdellovibrionaceae bacterium]|nr:S24 family peptidase [Pseudobdellovibrionaceae bacterium]
MEQSSAAEKNKNRNVSLLMETSISAGFPSPADDYIEKTLDLNDFLISRPSSTFMAWVRGDSMVGAGIFNKDLLIIDRSLEAHNRSIVLAYLNGEFTLKRLIKAGGRLFLNPENVKYKAIEVTEEMDFKIWGVLK